MNINVEHIRNYVIKPKKPLPHHSGEGRNPARKKNREADKIMMLFRLRGGFLIHWIPAFAGMTLFYLLDNAGSTWLEDA